MNTTQPTSIDEIVDFVRSAGSFELKKGMMNKWVFKRGDAEYYLADFLREKLTTLVEQAKVEGREDAVDYIRSKVEKRYIRFHVSDSERVDEVFGEAVRTISSDSKNI